MISIIWLLLSIWERQEKFLNNWLDMLRPVELQAFKYFLDAFFDSFSAK